MPVTSGAARPISGPAGSLTTTEQLAVQREVDQHKDGILTGGPMHSYNGNDNARPGPTPITTNAPGTVAEAAETADAETATVRSRRTRTPSPSRPLTSEKRLPSTTTLSAALPPGCSFGFLPKSEGTGDSDADSNDGAASPPERVIWVEFAPGDPSNPFNFSKNRKIAITGIACFFTFMSAFMSSSYAPSEESMCADLTCHARIEFASGVALYAFGFGVVPMFLAPFSEELGRKWTYIVAVFLFWVLNIPWALAKNMATVLIVRFLIGGAGSVGATLVGGTLSDVFTPAHRGLPMAIFGFCVMLGSGLGGLTMSFVEVALRWRWIPWIQLIILGVFMPICIVALPETRSTVILRRRAKKLRRERGMMDGARYIAHSEIEKEKLSVAMFHSLSRPFVFLIAEPTVTFFSLWISLGWGVFYVQIAGIPRWAKEIYGFDTQSLGLVYITMCIGGFIGLGVNFIQDHVYRIKAPTKGIEARLYAPMVAGIFFAIGCYITGFCSLPSVHWIGPCIGVTVLLAAVMTIYITTFTYLSECYSIYASSALAGQSFLRNMFAGGFTFFTNKMFDTLTVRWSLVMMGGFATLLAAVPFVAFWYGPAIRSRSKYCQQLMELERQAVEKERVGRLAAGMDVRDWEDLEAGANSVGLEGERGGAGVNGEGENGGEMERLEVKEVHVVPNWHQHRHQHGHGDGHDHANGRGQEGEKGHATHNDGSVRDNL